MNDTELHPNDMAQVPNLRSIILSMTKTSGIKWETLKGMCLVVTEGRFDRTFPLLEYLRAFELHEYKDSRGYLRLVLNDPDNPSEVHPEGFDPFGHGFSEIWDDMLDTLETEGAVYYDKFRRKHGYTPFVDRVFHQAEADEIAKEVGRGKHRKLVHIAWEVSSE